MTVPVLGMLLEATSNHASKDVGSIIDDAISAETKADGTIIVSTLG